MVLMKIFKFIFASTLLVLAGYVASKGFDMTNSSAADICFGTSLAISCLGLYFLLTII